MLIFAECRDRAIAKMVMHCLPLPEIPPNIILEYLEGHCDMTPAHGETLKLFPQSVDLRLSGIMAIFMLPETILRIFVPPLLRALEYEEVMDLPFPTPQLSGISDIAICAGEYLDKYLDMFGQLESNQIAALSNALVCVSTHTELEGYDNLANGLRILGEILADRIASGEASDI